MDKGGKELWYDGRGLTEEEAAQLLPLVFNQEYNGIMLTTDQRWLAEITPSGFDLLFYLREDKPEDRCAIDAWASERRVLLVSSEPSILTRYGDFERGAEIRVDDSGSLARAVNLTECHDYILIEFADETNIPLELVLAFSQRNRVKVCKRVTRADEGWIAGMVMEMGSHAILLSSRVPQEIIDLPRRMNGMQSAELKLEAMTVVEIRHIGMGDRVCVDTTSNLAPDEGMIIGSTSSGGLLLSSETHFLPYMDLRPFRVNAGALHSYVACPNGQTRYLSELKAGDLVMTANADGKTRAVTVGRIKMERRPLLLIRAVSAGGTEVNAIVQDDWHVRVLGPEGQAKNCTRLKAQERILGFVVKPGRHVGIAIDEMIMEK